MGSPRHYPTHTHLIWKIPQKGDYYRKKRNKKKKNNVRTEKRTILTLTCPQEECVHTVAREQQSVPSFALTDPLTDDKKPGSRTPPRSTNKGLGQRGQTKEEREISHIAFLTYWGGQTFLDMKTDTNWDKSKKQTKTLTYLLWNWYFLKGRIKKKKNIKTCELFTDIGILQPVLVTSSLKASVQKKTTCTVLLCCVK